MAWYEKRFGIPRAVVRIWKRAGGAKRWTKKTAYCPQNLRHLTANEAAQRLGLQ